MVKKLLIANAIVFVGCYFFGTLYDWGQFTPNLAVAKGQVWRFVSYQYLHVRNELGHIFWNMLLLYFLGNIMEQRWGQRKFLLLYTLFGIVGAILYAVLLRFEVIQGGAMIGASGSVLGLVGACAVAAPEVRVLVFFILPVRIRTVAIFVAIISLVMIMGTDESRRTADACHLGGLAMGALWAWLEAKGVIRRPSRVSGEVGPSGRKWVQVKVRKGAWEKKLKCQQTQQAEIDRILQKIHEKGLNSLSRGEKKLLQDASKDKR
jgi:membrane associated rhomboid family serine protease